MKALIKQNAITYYKEHKNKFFDVVRIAKKIVTLNINGNDTDFFFYEVALFDDKDVDDMKKVYNM